MKFFNAVEKLQNSEEGKSKIIIVKCGAFFVSIGKDAVILSTLLGLRVNCLKPGVCKVGMPINYVSGQQEYVLKPSKMSSTIKVQKF